jgi:hypothetical protein
MSPFARRWTGLFGAIVVVTLAWPTAVEAIPSFARKYRVSCALCHQPFPRLNAFGEQFAGNGFEMARGEIPPDTLVVGDALLRLQESLPLAVRIDAYVSGLTSDGSGTASDLQMPYNIKILSGGQITDDISYYLYFFLSERGEVSGLEDAYVQFSDIGGWGIDVIAGQFQVSDPLFKRELRLEYEDYALYRMRLGEARADLTYDRGFLAMWSPRDGTDLAFEVVNGTGLEHALPNRQYDKDRGKNVMARISQDLGPARVGAFGYWGRERSGGVLDEIGVWGVDATMGFARGRAELNAQYLARRDGNPFFLTSCSPSDSRCDFTAEDPLEAEAEGFMGELIFAPQGAMGRWHLYGLYNLVWADRPVFSVRLGEPDGVLDRYETAGVGASYLMARNFRFVGEVTRDLEFERTRFILGLVAGF